MSDPYQPPDAEPGLDADEEALRTPFVVKAASAFAGAAGLFGVGSLLQGLLAIAWAPTWVWALLVGVGASGALALASLLGLWRLRPLGLAGALAGSGLLAILGATWCLGAAWAGLLTPAPLIASAIATVALPLLLASSPAVRAADVARRRLAREGLTF